MHTRKCRFCVLWQWRNTTAWNNRCTSTVWP